MVAQRDSSSGLVLGLTMAESAMLIIFVLLLALTALLSRAEEELARFEQLQAELEENKVGVEELIEQIGVSTEARRDADNWRKLVRGIERQTSAPSPESIVSRLQEADKALEHSSGLRAIDEAFKEAGIEPEPEHLRSVAELARAGHEAGLTPDEVRDAIRFYPVIEALRGSSAEMTPRVVVQLVADAKRWRGQEGGGRGTDHPSCWTDDDESVAYLFDVALRDDGFVMRPARALPRHDEERENPPLSRALSRVRTGEILTAQQFLEQTELVFSWSVDRDCRFFARAFDLTSADQKELYKDRMRTLESRFYKNANPSGPPPSVDPPPLRP